MDMSEKVSFEIMKGWDSFKDFFRSIIDAIIKIKDSVCRRMGYQDIRICWDTSIVATLTVGYAIAHEHRDTVELQTLNLNSGVTQVMHIVIKTVNVGSIEAIVMVATDKYFMFVWQVTKPVEEIKGLLFGSYHAEVTGMYYHIGLR